MKTITSHKNKIVNLGILVVAFVVLALVPTITQGYWVTLITDILRYVVLAVAWVIFSGSHQLHVAGHRRFLRSWLLHRSRGQWTSALPAGHHHRRGGGLRGGPVVGALTSG